MPRILFVDDEPALLELFRDLLAPGHPAWTIELAASGPAALEILRARPCDVVVSDMSMPGMDGVRLLEEVASRQPAATRIMLSGTQEDRDRLRVTGLAHQYLGKPSELGTLGAVLERVLAVQGAIGAPALRALVARLRALPSPPATYVRLRELGRAPDVSLRAVAELVSEDPAMTARLLQLVNSAFFGRRHRVSSPLAAVQLLGLDIVSALVLSVHVFAACDPRLVERCALDDLWRHSLRVGAGASAIAALERVAPPLPDDARVAGLLHGVGVLALASGAAADYPALIATARRTGQTVHDLEIAAFGVSHAEVGGHLLGLWGLPTEIVEAVALHPSPGFVPGPALTALTIVHAANALAHEIAPRPVRWTPTSIDARTLGRIPDDAPRLASWREVCRTLDPCAA
jgi:HD-like signal output (HDOD) protein/ActR/RegA family two-component response regulator